MQRKPIRLLSLGATAYLTYFFMLILMQRVMLYQEQTTEAVTPPSVVSEDVRFKSEDGTELHGWWIDGPQGKNGPVLLYCHGNGATLSQLDHVAKIFSGYNLNALMFDYRSYGTSEKKQLSEEGLAQDARAAYDWIKTEKGFRDDQIVIWGHSLGGAVASRLATEREPAALITEGAFSSVLDIARYRYPWLPLFEFMILDKYKAAKYLSTRKMPLLMLHAENDTVIPISFGQKAFEMAAEPKNWLLIKDIDHNDFPSVNEVYRKDILEFINNSQTK